MPNPGATENAVRLDEATQRLVGRLLRDYLRPHALRIALAVLCMGVAAAATAASAWMMQPILDDVFDKRDEVMLYVVPVVVLAIFAIKGISTYGQSVLMTFVGQHIIADMQRNMFAHLMRADLAFFNNTSTGTLISRFTHDVNLLRGALNSGLTSIAMDALTLIFLVGVMFYRDWLLATVAFVVFPVSLVPIVRVGRRMRRVSADTQERMGAMTTLLDETFQGVRHVKAYGMESHETSRAAALIETVFGLIYKAAKARAVLHPFMETMGGVAIAVVIFYGGSRVIAGTTSAGAFFSFITALLLAYQPMKKLANLNATLQEGLAAAQRVFAMLDLEPKIVDRPDARELTVRQGNVAFEDVHFAYATGKPALHGITLTVPAGKTAALVGPSGAGKSTILNLIPRFYDVDAGRITIDGVDLRDVTLASLRGHIGLVSQEISLFDDTVRANIGYGRAGASEDEIAAAAKSAAAHDFIVALPHGYDTLVGEHGIKLSGGQRQRVAIARAMLKNAPILLLDEATSSLDSESERQVQDALEQLMAGRTTLVIAHRLSTVVRADIIFVVETGRVVEFGSHAELLARPGPYARLYALQFAEEEGTTGPPATEGARAQA